MSKSTALIPSHHSSGWYVRQACVVLLLPSTVSRVGSFQCTCSLPENVEMCRSEVAVDLGRQKESFSLPEHVSMSRDRESPATKVGLSLPLRKSTVLSHEQLKYFSIFSDYLCSPTWHFSDLELQDLNFVGRGTFHPQRWERLTLSFLRRKEWWRCASSRCNLKLIIATLRGSS